MKADPGWTFATGARRGFVIVEGLASDWPVVDGHQDLPTGGHQVGPVTITDSDRVR
jgi:hypothetical protein